MSPPVTVVYDWFGNEVVMKQSTAELVLGDGLRLRIPPELTGPCLGHLLRTVRAC